MDYRILSSIVLSVVVLSLVPVQYAEAHHCSITHLDECIKDAVKDAINATVKPVIDEIKKEVGTIKTEINVVKDDVKKVDQKVTAIEKSLGKDLGGIVKDIEKDVTEIEKDAESLENTVVNDIKTDLEDVAKDVAIIAAFVDTAEDDIEKAIEITERLERILAHDVFVYFWYIVGAIIAILLAILGHRIYDAWRKREVADAILEINKNLKKLVGEKKFPPK